MAVAESHMLGEMRTVTVVQSINTSRWICHLESEYGYSEKFAHKAVYIWCDALGKGSMPTAKPTAKSEDSVVSPSSYSKTMTSRSMKTPKTNDAPVSTSRPASAPQPSPVAKTTDPYHGQNKADFQIKDGVLVKYVGNQSKVVIPDNVTSIEEMAFMNNDTLKEIIITNGVVSVGNCAFYNCSGLTHVFIPNSVTSIGYCVFDGCKQLKRITVQEGNTRYYSKGNCLIDKEHESSFKSAKNAKEFHALKEKQTIDGVRSVGKSKETDNSDTVSVCKKNEGTRNSPKSKNERKAKQPGRFIYIASDNGPFVEYKLVQLDNDASKKR